MAAQDYFNRKKKEKKKKCVAILIGVRKSGHKERGKGLGVRVMRGAQAMVYMD